MKNIICLVLLAVFFMSPFFVRAEQSSAVKYQLHKADIDDINIISSKEDKISLYVKDRNQKIYRISSVSQQDASVILNRLGGNEPLEVEAVPVEQKKYLDVIEWR